MSIKDDLANEGVTLVAIGSGSPKEARIFVDSFDFQGEIYVDQGLRVFEAFDLERGFWKTLGPGSLVKGIKALGQGFKQGRSAGDLWQQGGVFVLGPGDQILFEHRDIKAGFHAEPTDILSACRLSGSESN